MPWLTMLGITDAIIIGVALVTIGITDAIIIGVALVTIGIGVRYAVQASRPD